MPVTLSIQSIKNRLLCGAAYLGLPRTVRLLIAVGADKDAKYKKNTALILAAWNGYEKIARQLIAAGADVDAANENDNTALILAAIWGHEEIAKQLIAAGANINATDKNDDTALIFAAINGHEEVVRQLIAAGAYINLRNKKGHTALIIAACCGHKEIVAQLIAADEDRNTALILSARHGYEKIVRQLIEAGADVNAKNKNGDTALHMADRFKHEGVARYLIEQGANITVNGRSCRNLLPDTNNMEWNRLELGIPSKDPRTDALTRDTMPELAQKLKEHNFTSLRISRHWIVCKVDQEKNHVLICNSGKGLSEYHHAYNKKFLTGQYFTRKDGCSFDQLKEILNPKDPSYEYPSVKSFYEALNSVADKEDCPRDESDRWQTSQKGQNCAIESLNAAYLASCIANDPKNGRSVYTEKRMKRLEGGEDTELDYRTRLQGLIRSGNAMRATEKRLGFTVQQLDEAIKVEIKTSEMASRTIERKLTSRHAKIYHPELYKKSNPGQTVNVMLKNCDLTAALKQMIVNESAKKGYLNHDAINAAIMLLTTLAISEYCIADPLKDFTEKQKQVLLAEPLKSIIARNLGIDEHQYYIATLEEALKERHEATAKAKFSISVQDKAGNTALILAAWHGYEKIARQLIAAGTDINAGNENGNTALILAAWQGHEEIVQQLIAAGTDINAGNENGDTALILAAWQGREEIVRQLIEAGAYLEVKNKNADTALIRAALKGHAEIVAQLIVAGADIYVENSKGQTALNFAQCNGGNEITDQIILQHIKNQTGHKYDSLDDVFGALELESAVCRPSIFTITNTLRQTISDLGLTYKIKGEFITALRGVTTLAKRPCEVNSSVIPTPTPTPT